MKSDEKLKLLVDAWKDVKIDGADLMFNSMEVPEMNPDFDWPEDMDIDDLPDEAFTGEMVTRLSIAWKAWINGKKYGNYIIVDEPICTPELVNVISENYRLAKEKIEKDIVH